MLLYCEPVIKRQGLMERKIGLLQMPAFQEDGQRPPPPPFLVGSEIL